MTNDKSASANTDTEIYRGPSRCEWGDEDRFYADSLFITKTGALGINCGGTAYVKPIRDWFALATTESKAYQTGLAEGKAQGAREALDTYIRLLKQDWPDMFPESEEELRADFIKAMERQPQETEGECDCQHPGCPECMGEEA